MSAFDGPDLGSQSAQILQYLVDNGPSSLPDLAEELALDEGELEEMLEALAEERLVVGDEDEETWELTARGVNVLADQSLGDELPLHEDELDQSNGHQPIERELDSAGYGIERDD